MSETAKPTHIGSAAPRRLLWLLAAVTFLVFQATLCEQRRHHQDIKNVQKNWRRKPRKKALARPSGRYSR